MPATTPRPFAGLFATVTTVVCAAVPARSQLPPSVREVRLRVLDAKGGPVQDLRVRVCGVVAENERYAALPGQDWRALQPKDFAGDHVRLGDLPDGQLVLFVEADCGALTVSRKLELPARKPIELTVRLREGGTLTGTVTTPDGKPVAGAELCTLDRNEANQHPFVRAIGAMLVAPVTCKTVRTGDDGTFRIANVAPGRYLLRATHADWAELRREVAVKGKADKELGELPMLAGGVVSGAVQRAGKCMADAIVVLESTDMVGEGPLAYPAIRIEVRTDAQGEFTLPRVPFGSYQVYAHLGGAPIQQAQMIGASKRAVEVKPRPDGAPRRLLLELPWR
ncbi:MAG: carboxypeptidase-like regulatory domain-containing protein [Planctomycetota bacterium]